MCMEKWQGDQVHRIRQAFVCLTISLQSHCPRKIDIMYEMCTGPGEDVEERPQLGHLHGRQRG